MQRIPFIPLVITACVLVAAPPAAGHSWELTRSAEIRADVFDVFVLRDGMHGWLATSVGPYRTEDGGVTWTLGLLPVTSGVGAICFVDENEGWAVSCGYTGVIFHSTDGGRNWETSFYQSDVWFTDIFFVDRLHGWAAAEDNIVRTLDGGATWIVDYHLAWYPEAVYFVSPLRGWMAGDEIYDTRDGGASWSHHLIAPGSFTGVAFADSSIGCVVGAPGIPSTGAILYTTDGGATWLPPALPAVWPALRDISLDATGRGIAVGDGGAILETPDAGQNWSKAESGLQNGLRGVCVRSAVTWVGGSAGAVLRELTLPYRGEWQRLTTLANALQATTFADAEHGLIVGARGITFRTEDGGSTWTEGWIPAAAYGDLQSVAMVGPDSAWTCGTSAGGVHRSLDGGRTWVESTMPLAGHVVGVDFGDALHGWCVINSAALAHVCHSADGGETWLEQPSGAAWYWSGVFALDSLHVWTYGWEPSHSLVGRSIDGGQTWTMVPLSTEAVLYSLAFRDESVGFAGTDGGAIIATDDGGLTWHDVHQIESNAAWLDIAFSDPSEVLAVGARLEPDQTTTGLIDRSTKISPPWWRELESTGSHLLGVAFASPFRGFAVGNWGEIFACSATGEVPEAAAESSSSLSLRVLGNPMSDAAVFDVRFPNSGSTDPGLTPGSALVEIFDVSGAWVRTLTCLRQGAEAARLAWDGFSATGRPAPAGAYFARVQAGDLKATVRFIRLR